MKSISQLLHENDILLHVITDNVITPKKVLGFDGTKAFVRKDQTKFNGDAALKALVTPVNGLGQCSALAIDTNGSVFTSKTPSSKKSETDFKVIPTVFAKRIVQTVRPKPCHMCECEGHNSGTAFMTCMSCEHQSSFGSEYVEETFDTDIPDSYEE